MASVKNTPNHSTVVGVFDDARMAQAAVEELRRVGFREDQVGVVARGASGESSATVKEGTGSHWEEGAAVGVATGAGIGALWAVGMATIALPPILPAVLVSSWLVSVLASAASGAAIAGLAGALIGLGIPEDEAAYYEGEFKTGRTLVTVQAPGRYEEARDILRRFGAYDHANRRVDAAGTATHATAAGGQTVKVHEEKLHAHKQPVNTGEVRIHKDVVTEHKTLNVPVTREEVVIERRPVSGKASTSDIRAGEEIRIPVREEKVTVEKETVVTEEVNVGKRQVTENQQVGGTVRKEKVHVEEKGDVDVKNRRS